MPVDLPNPKLFKPHIPKAMAKHFLFGTKFFKVHQFQDTRWPPTSITHQYQIMSSCLKKNVQYKKFRLAANSVKQMKTVQRVRQECIDGRTRIKNAHAGNLTEIRRILMKRKDLQRKYKTMPLSAIMENCDQETFLRRKENDRLKYQLKTLSSNLQITLLEQAKMEDRIKYANEFVLQTELDAKVVRKDLKKSQTRIEAYKLITRAYQRILSIMKRDDVYFESVLDAIEGDIAEQQNFIHQIVLLGIPAKKQYNKLAEEYRVMDENSKEQTQEHSKFVSNVRKQLMTFQKETKFVVRNYNPPKPRAYVRTTPSITTTGSAIEELETIINEIRLVTMSPDAATIQTTLDHLVKNVNYFDKKNKIDDKYKAILGEKYDRALGEINLLYHNYSQPEAEKLQNIEDLRIQIKYQQKLQKQCNQRIVNSGNLLRLLDVSLWNIVEVLRHIGKKVEILPKDYPNVDLKLPLLKFDFLNLKSVPPIEYDIKAHKLLQLAKDKISQLVKTPLYKSATEPESVMRKIYHDTYLKSIEEDDTGVTRISTTGEQMLTSPPTYAYILTRGNIKDMSAKIVEKCKKKDTDA